MPEPGLERPGLSHGMPRRGQQMDGWMDGDSETWRKLPGVKSKVINPFRTAAQKEEKVKAKKMQ